MSLRSIFDNKKGRRIFKWNHYFPIYENHFKELKSRVSPTNKVRMLEIGMWTGGSMEMFKEYFGKDNCEIIGIDIDSRLKSLESTLETKIFIGDQEDQNFLATIVNEIGSQSMDIILDDGGHKMKQQINSFISLFWSFLKPGGIYLVEDAHTSYWSEYGGGLNNPQSFIEFSKAKIDELNGYHIKQGSESSITAFTLHCSGIHFYDSIVVFDKAVDLIERPTDTHRGDHD